MESKPELYLKFRYRAILLLLLISSTAASIPLDNLKAISANWSQGETRLLLSFTLDILQRPKVLTNIISHPYATGNILRYFQETANITDSAWWLNHKAGLLALFSDADTYVLLGNNPWLFGLLRVVNETYPTAYNRMIVNRAFFNTLLHQVVGHPEFKTIFTFHPEYLPLIYNLTVNQPFDQAWTRIIHPSPSATIGNLTAILVFTLSLDEITDTSLTLTRNNAPIQALSGIGTVIYNATLNTTGLPEGEYQLQVIVTLATGVVLQNIITINYSKSVAVTP